MPSRSHSSAASVLLPADEYIDGSENAVTRSGPQRARRQGGHQRRVDAARHRHVHALVVGLAQVVGNPHAQRALHGAPVVGAGGDRLAGLRAVPHQELFLEARALQHQLAAGVGDHRLAIEQQPVVAAHHVHVHHRHARASADARQEAAPHPRLAAVVGRGGGRHQQGRALVQAVAHRVHGVAAGGVGLGLPPDVLADGEPDALALELDDAALGGRLEVARLVEHVVGGQQGLGL